MQVSIIQAKMIETVSGILKRPWSWGGGVSLSRFQRLRIGLAHQLRPRSKSEREVWGSRVMSGDIGEMCDMF